MKLSENKNWDAAMKIGGTIALLLLFNKANANAKKNSAEADMDTNPAAGQAASLKQAMNPSGFRILKNIDGANKEAIMRIAPQITNLDDVNTHYKGISDNVSLYEDLQAALSPDDYQKFLSLATKGKTGSWFYTPKSENVPANKWVITTKQANVRSTPVYLWAHSAISNIVKLVPPGMALGATTGKFVYDEKNKVLFIEFWTYNSKFQKKIFFVAKSQVELISKEEKEKREKTAKIPLQLLEGLGDTNDHEQREVISTDTALVYDEKFNQIGLTRKNTTMGTLIMMLKTGKHGYIQFQTIQGKKRWMREEYVKIRDKKV